MERTLLLLGKVFHVRALSQVSDPGSHPVANQKLFLTLFYGVWPLICPHRENSGNLVLDWAQSPKGVI